MDLSKVKGVNLVDIDGRLVEQLFISTSKQERSVIVAIVEDNKINSFGGASNSDLLKVAEALINQVSRTTGVSVVRIGADIVSNLMLNKAIEENDFGGMIDDLLKELKRRDL